MTDVLMIQMLREALMITLVVSAPLLGIGMIVGLIISIFQTTTSIQEQTLTFVPKIVAIFVAIIFFAGWMISMLTDYTRKIFMLISKLGGMM
ncbi:MAG TPA: flagellar biosynthesis protein FliQ [Spirochaetota bacterium]|jgi:flagellar biosynthetic protein FliQ|nr:flagellar biosynthesis protein FliQ [Spirochaetota bacterium]HOR43772.1 flagellar biosynthesis protein FliQ [Spirochaetota bacterium]HOU84208.1 flagellar biosynthesis protein FliQ [Spirochaetota bacterium]HPA62665.1 flagellar biosynthesis protein FliQ [Spirochaetota bacterium]HPK57197.1 flagellar biosynthesis protein FliQ [Spirochaetota bacterium]